MFCNYGRLCAYMCTFTILCSLDHHFLVSLSVMNLPDSLGGPHSHGSARTQARARSHARDDTSAAQRAFPERRVRFRGGGADTRSGGKAVFYREIFTRNSSLRASNGVHNPLSAAIYPPNPKFIKILLNQEIWGKKRGREKKSDRAIHNEE